MLLTRYSNVSMMLILNTEVMQQIFKKKLNKSATSFKMRAAVNLVFNYATHAFVKKKSVKLFYQHIKPLTDKASRIDQPALPLTC